MSGSGGGKVAVVVGSDSDLPIMESCCETLKRLDIPHVLRVISAHRTPEEARDFALSAEEEGVSVIIAAAGMAAHLAGSLAAHTRLPVIGVPMAGGALSGLDALLSTVQMPSGVPVATVAVGRAGAVNAAVLAAEILALSDEELGRRLRDYRQTLRQSVVEKDKKNARGWP